MYFALFPLFGVYSWGHSKCKAQRITRNTSRSCPTLCLGYQLQHSPILSGGGPDRTLQAVRVVPHPPLLPPPHKAGHWPGGGGSSGGCGTSRVAWSVWSGFPSHKIILAMGSQTRLLAALAAFRTFHSTTASSRGIGTVREHHRKG